MKTSNDNFHHDFQCVALSDGMGNATSTTSESHASQCHSTLAVVEATSDGMGYMLKPLKQKLFVDGLCYLLQEIYGLENKAAPYRYHQKPTSNFELKARLWLKLKYCIASFPILR